MQYSCWGSLSFPKIGHDAGGGKAAKLTHQGTHPHIAIDNGVAHGGASLLTSEDVCSVDRGPDGRKEVVAASSPRSLKAVAGCMAVWQCGTSGERGFRLKKCEKSDFSCKKMYFVINANSTKKAVTCHEKCKERKESPGCVTRQTTGRESCGGGGEGRRSISLPWTENAAAIAIEVVPL